MGLAVVPLVAPVASADPVGVDVEGEGFLLCVVVTTDRPLPPGENRVCTVP